MSSWPGAYLVKHLYLYSCLVAISDKFYVQMGILSFLWFYISSVGYLPADIQPDMQW
jgi:hypothetical protein